VPLTANVKLGMKREAKLFAYFAVFLGCFGILAGVGILVDGSNPQAGLSCRAICGLTLLTTELLGNFAGSLIGGLLWIISGSALSLFGYFSLTDKHSV